MCYIGPGSRRTRIRGLSDSTCASGTCRCGGAILTQLHGLSASATRTRSYRQRRRIRRCRTAIGRRPLDGTAGSRVVGAVLLAGNLGVIDAHHVFRNVGPVVLLSLLAFAGPGTRG